MNVPWEMSARNKLIHAMPLNTDRPINRAMVVGCAISATRNYLKLHMPRTLNPLLSNIHAKTRKLWKCSAMRVAASQPGAVHQSTDRPLMHSAWPPRCPLHSPGRPCMRACTSSGAALTPTIESRQAILIAFAASQCPTARDFVPWRFSAAGRLSAQIEHHPGVRKPAQERSSTLSFERHASAN